MGGKELTGQIRMLAGTQPRGERKLEREQGLARGYWPDGLLF
jgi:hypothetical protein